MVTSDTLQIINSDLDVQLHQQFNERPTKSGLENVEVQVLDEIGSDESNTEQDEEMEKLPEKHPNDTEHMKIYNEMIAFYALVGKGLGIRISFEWNWKKNLFFVSGAWLLFFCWICIAYTIIIHYANGNYVRILEPATILGISVSCTQKYYAFVTKWKSMLALIFNLRSMCRRTADGCGRANVLAVGLRRTLKFMKIYAFTVMLTSSFYFVVPLKVFFVDKEMLSMIPMEVIFCDQSTLSGFLVANFCQGILGYLAVAKGVLFGLTFITVVCGYFMKVDMLAEDFKDLDKMWTGTVKASVAYRHAFLLNICKKRQDMNRYLHWIKKIYELNFFYYYCVNYFSQIIILYQIKTSDWQSGYGTLLGLFVEMMFYCIMGTQISISTDRLCAVIYNTKWYDYDLLSQRTICMLLKEAQINKDIRIGVIGSLNLMTFIKIVKSIYTYYTVLIELL